VEVDVALLSHATPRVLCLACFAAGLAAQEMQPRAYIPTPVGVNFFGVSYANSQGGLLFDPSLPIDDGQVNANIFTLAFGQTLSVLGRTAQILTVFPYVRADLSGRVAGSEQQIYRSGLGDAVFRYAMNLYGAHAMTIKEFSEYRQKTIVGASITVLAPLGQYDPVRLVNVGTNRWAFKPEIGVSRALGKWTLEGAAGVWLYTPNEKFNGTLERTQSPLGSLQAHVVRTLPHRTWLAIDWTYYTGGRTRVDGLDKPDYLGNSRVGATFGIVLSRRQAIKITYFDGAVTRVGGSISSIGISYSVVWLRGR
jgi:hypothetical protein